MTTTTYYPIQHPTRGNAGKAHETLLATYRQYRKFRARALADLARETADRERRRAERQSTIVTDISLAGARERLVACREVIMVLNELRHALED
jgi:hypothetical protein